MVKSAGSRLLADQPVSRHEVPSSEGALSESSPPEPQPASDQRRDHERHRQHQKEDRERGPRGRRLEFASFSWPLLWSTSRAGMATKRTHGVHVRRSGIELVGDAGFEPATPCL